MSSKPPETLRHRIQEIRLRPAPSTSVDYPISLKILADNKEINKTPEITPEKPLQWSLTLHHDMHPTSRIEVRVYEHRTFGATRRRIGTVDYGVDDTTVPSPDCAPPGWAVVVVFPPPQPTGAIASQVLSEVQAMDRQKRLLDRLGPFRKPVEVILKFGTAVSECDPRSKAAFATFNAAWKTLSTPEKCDVEIETLINGLADILPSVDVVKHAVKLPKLKLTVDALWNLIEDASRFVMGYMSTGEAVLILESFTGSSAQEEVNKLLSKLRELKETFDRGINIQILQAVDDNVRRTLLDKLSPVGKARYDTTRACIPGTREVIIGDILGWAKEAPGPNNSTYGERLMWVHGQAGLGKSAIATAVCENLDGNCLLASSFFCKRDDPDRRNPQRILSTILFGLAIQHPTYAEAVRKVLEEDPMLPSSPMPMQIDRLVWGILGSPSFTSSETRHVIVVDALDECTKEERRYPLLLEFFLHVSKLVPWLKFIITSRPDPDIKAFFDLIDDKGIFTIRDLYKHDASDDIHAFVQQRFHGSTKGRSLGPHAANLIAEKAAGLFIWARTACEFILADDDPPDALKSVLATSGSGESSHLLDRLYTMAVKASISEQQGVDRARENVKKCLGAIIVCSSRKPLSITALSNLFGKHIRKQVLKSVVDRLSSVLYSDQESDNAIRVYHSSFADYMLAHERSGKFSVDVEEQNSYLACRCLDVMMNDLKFNICGLETSYERNQQVADLQSRIDRAIGHHLRYICTYWASHLIESQDEQSIDACQPILERFLSGPFVLYWIEVLSLLAKLNVGLLSIQKLQAHYQRRRNAPTNELSEVGRFIQAFYQPILESTPHLYISALAFLPSNSSMNRIRSLYFPNTIKLAEGVERKWTPWTKLISHEAPVHAVAVSPSDRRIVSGLGDNTMRVWDADTGTSVGEPLAGHSDVITSVAFSLDGRRIVSGSSDKTVRVWDTGSSPPVSKTLTGHSGRVTSVTFSPNGQHIVSGSHDHTVQVWDASTGAPADEPSTGHSDVVTSVTFSPDGFRIASGSWDSTVRVWDASTGAPVGKPLVGHSRRITSVAFSPDGHRLVSGSWDHTVRVWDGSTGNPVGEPLAGHLSVVTSVTFSSDGCLIVSGSYDGTVRVWNTSAGAPIGQLLTGHSDVVTSVAFLFGPWRIVSGSLDSTVRVWDADMGTQVSEPLAGHSHWVTSVAFSSDGRHIVSGSSDKTVQVWDASTGAPVGEPLAGRLGSVTSVAFSPDGRYIISGSYDETVRVWDASTGAPVGEPLAGHSGAVTSVAFSFNGQHIISGSDDCTVRVWDKSTGDPVGKPLAGHTGRVTSVAFSFDCHHIVSGSSDKTVRVWDVSTSTPVGKLLAGHLAMVTSVAFSPNGQHIVCGLFDHTVRIWDVSTGAPVCEPLTGHVRVVSSVAVSLDGCHIASGSWDNTVRVWETSTGAPVGEPLFGHSDWVTCVTFSSDSRYIVSGSKDKTVRVWNVGRAHSIEDSLVAYLRAHSTMVSPPNKPRIDRSSLAIGEETVIDSFPPHTFLRQNVYRLMKYCAFDGWVSALPGELLFWLPPEYQRYIREDSLFVIPSEVHSQPVWLDFSCFMHGTDWTNVIAPSDKTITS